VYDSQSVFRVLFSTHWLYIIKALAMLIIVIYNIRFLVPIQNIRLSKLKILVGKLLTVR